MLPRSDCIVTLRASRIHDPVAKLRYLRAHAVVEEAPKRNRRDPLLVAIAGIALCGFAAGPILPRAERQAQPPSRLESKTAKSPAAIDRPAVIWTVETARDHELYSNGLRIDTRFTRTTQPRSYVLFSAKGEEKHTEPAGIVYHSTESDLLPFGPEYNEALRRAADSVVSFVQRHQSYHYLIDRFGRVYRVIRDDHMAEHAGHSVWAWNNAACLNLNNAFFGVAFEGRTNQPLSPAQVNSGKLLTQVLLNRYGIRTENCVTHAQVSVNPSNMKIGWHTDWARALPFIELGLPNNYERPLPSVVQFGFRADEAYLDTAGESLWVGVQRSETEIKNTAARQGVDPHEWRRQLEKRYRDLTNRG